MMNMAETIKKLKATELRYKNGEKKLVRARCKIKLIPPEEKEYVDESEKQHDKVRYYFIRGELGEGLGEGRYTIDRIGQLPSGKILLFLEQSPNKEAGFYAENFRAL